MGSSLWLNGEQKHTALPGVAQGLQFRLRVTKTLVYTTARLQNKNVLHFEFRGGGVGEEEEEERWQPAVQETIAQIKCHRDNYFQLTVVGQS